VDGEIIGRGVGRSKAEATQNAARQALNRLNGIHED
jgi:dsRNA-specific ribonuclease